MTRRPRRGEAGFTLVELVVAITIQAMIMGALAMAFIAILNGHKNVGESLNRSGDARIAANYVVSDARNSSGPELSLNDTASCPDPSPPVAGAASPVVRFNWNSTSSAGVTTANIVNYVLVSHTLLRRVCQGGTLVSDKPVASSVSTTSVTCSPTANCTGSPTTITVTVTETADSTGAVYQYSLTGNFRKLNGAGPPIVPQSMILLGAGNCTNGATGIKVAGGSSMRVYGNTMINTADGSTCKAMSLGTDAGNFVAGGTQFLTGGSCLASGSSSCPTSTTYSPALADPYANLPALAGVPAGACSGSNPTPVGGVYPSGVYPTALNIATPGAVLSGTYIFCNGLSITNGATVTGSNVLMYFKGGSILVNGNAQVTLSAPTSGSYKGLIIWQPSGNATTLTFSNGGVFTLDGAIYAPSAIVNFTGGSVGTKVKSVVALLVSSSGGATVTFGSPSPTPLSITTTSPLPGWTVNQPLYSTTLAADGGNGNYIWAATNLPAGLSIDPDTGIISGTPTAAIIKSVAVTLNDDLGDDPDPATLSLTINVAPTISTTSPLPNATQGIAYTPVTLAGATGTTPYSWSATGLPAGMSISTGGVISGTPTANGTSTVNVTLTDNAAATVSKSLSLTVAPRIVSVALANGGGTPGTIDQGDTITIVFSTTMKVSSFCSAWSNNAANQSLVANGDVTVAVSNGSPDAVTVTSAACPSFSLGSIGLGSSGYTTVAATFSGSGVNKSAINYTAATNTMVITLGAKAAGTLTNVASSTPTYTASGSIQDSLGVALGNSPFTPAAGQQF